MKETRECKKYTYVYNIFENFTKTVKKSKVH